MSEDKNKGPFLPVSTLIFLLAAVGITVFNPSPFKGLRPSVSELREPYEKVTAKLWQDPFRAVVDHVKAIGSLRSVKNAGQFGLLHAEQDNMTAEDSLLSQIHRNGGQRTRVIVLGFMVPGGPFAEDTETRIRNRYAALSGLRRLGFVPQDPDHIDFSIVSTQKDQKSESISFSSIMPFEWLKNNEGNDRVLFLWINSDLFQNKPLAKLNRLSQCLQLSQKPNDPDGTSFKFIGPPDSDMLVEMLREARDDSGKLSQLSGLEIYSAIATVDDFLLLENIGEQTHGLSEAEARRKIEKQFSRRGIKFYRTILTDRELAESLFEELDRRGVDLKEPRSGDHVVLIAEWDTFYGRSLPLTFEKVYREKVYGKKVVPPEKVAERVHRISYLRGIDGSLPGEKEKKKDEQSQSVARPEDEIKKLEQAAGKSQFDYLRRLADEMYILDKDLKTKDEAIKAIGILGSDYYDKFLVLQAFRQRFPEAVFFTTDLDARLSHPANVQWTRNLVVASSFDLRLRKDEMDIQGEVPPFRDSYQTSLFFAILRALGGDYLENDQKKSLVMNQVQPLVFEIGWNKAFNLTALSPAEDVQPRRHLVEGNKRLFLEILGIAGFMLLLLCCTSATFLGAIKDTFSTPLKVLISAGVILVIVAISLSFYYLILSESKEEPFSLFEGISIWPTAILRAFAFVLSIFFLIVSHANLKKNSDDIVRELGLGAECADHETAATKDKIWKTFRRYWGYGWKIDASKPMDCLWAEYARRDSEWYRTLRMLPIVISYIFLCVFIMKTFGFPVSPVRGDFSRLFDKVILYASVFAFTLLIFYVFDVIRICRQFIVNVSGQAPQWPANPFNGSTSSIETEELRPLSEWLLVHLVARRTDAVGKLIFFPFIVWFIMFLARFYYFDNWQTPIGLALVFTLSAVYVWSCAYSLRKSAENLRKASVRRLKENLVKKQWKEGQNGDLKQQTEFVLSEVNSIREGAFAPFSQHPLVQALGVPFGGVGGVYIMDFLTKMNF